MSVDDVITTIGSIHVDTNVIAGIIIGAILFRLLFVFHKAQQSRRLDFAQMITRDGVVVSASKVLQLIGGIVGTWIVIYATLKGTLDWDIFAIYLAYVASVEGFSKFIVARYGYKNENPTESPTISGGVQTQIIVQGKQGEEQVDESEQEVIPSDVRGKARKIAESETPPPSPLRRRKSDKGKPVISLE